jgi:hypothetical protein
VTTRHHLVPSSKNAWSYTTTPRYVFMARYLVKLRDNCTFLYPYRIQNDSAALTASCLTGTGGQLNKTAHPPPYDMNLWILTSTLPIRIHEMVQRNSCKITFRNEPFTLNALSVLLKKLRSHSIRYTQHMPSVELFVPCTKGRAGKAQWYRAGLRVG